MLEITQLKKSFKSLVAVNNLSFAVHPGEIYGLLGPNGAGKTTTIHMITGLLEPDSGTIRFDNDDVTRAPVAFKRHLGVAPQEIALYDDLSAWDNLMFWGGIHNIPRHTLRAACSNAATRVGLSDRLKSPVKTFSGGMKRRLNLAAAILHSPRLLLLDEPTAGVDPQSRHHILTIVRDIAANGAAVLYTTHYLEEAEALCHRIGIIDTGSLVAEGTLPELCDTISSGRIVSLTGRFHPSETPGILSNLTGTTIAHADADTVVLRLESDDHLVSLMKTIFNLNLDIHSVAVKPPSLETVFLMLTGKELRD
ncbi:ABC transporter ATP-binding protein [bacterium]|nr:ABC transporter ATP-binding protein [candidate division CSSED10-310 bacterium]